MSDLTRLGLLLVTFALAVTVHVLVVAGLVSRRTSGRAALAFFVPPLAPAFAWRAGMRARATAWLACAALYAVALTLAHGGS